MKTLLLAIAFCAAGVHADSEAALPLPVLTWIDAQSISEAETRAAVIDEVVSEGFVSRAMDGTEIGNRDSLKQFLLGAHAALANYQLSVVDSAVADERVWLRLNASGTHAGPLLGVAPTGRRISVASVVVLEIVDERITAEWLLTDTASMARQLHDADPPK